MVDRRELTGRALRLTNEPIAREDARQKPGASQDVADYLRGVRKATGAAKATKGTAIKRDYYNPIVARLWSEKGIPAPVRELEFAKESHDRKFRFDLCWPDRKIYLEIDGGNYAGGRHTRPEALARDYEKRNLATILGWRGLWCEPKDRVTAEFIGLLACALVQP
jgi:hypothetical protein